MTGRDAEAGFTADLFHNLGVLGMEQLDPSVYANLWRTHADHAQALLEAEARVFGFNHRQVSARLLATWGLPAEICDAVAASARPTGCAAHNLDDIVALVVPSKPARIGRRVSPTFVVSPLTR